MEIQSSPISSLEISTLKHRPLLKFFTYHTNEGSLLLTDFREGREILTSILPFNSALQVLTKDCESRKYIKY